MVGLIGIVFAVAVFVALAYGTGDLQSSLEVFGPMATFALPRIAMIAFWWNDWPGTRLRAPLSGLIDTVLVVVLAVGLTMAGEAIVERFDVSSVFRARPGPGHPTTFPATLPLAGAAFAAMLQLTLVSEGWPLRRLGRIWSGVAALVVSWAVSHGGISARGEHGLRTGQPSGPTSDCATLAARYRGPSSVASSSPSASGRPCSSSAYGAGPSPEYRRAPSA